MTTTHAVGGVSANAQVRDFGEPDVDHLFNRRHDVSRALFLQISKSLETAERCGWHGLRGERVSQLGRLIINASPLPMRHRGIRVFDGIEQGVDVGIAREVAKDGFWWFRRFDDGARRRQRQQRRATREQPRCRHASDRPDVGCASVPRRLQVVGEQKGLRGAERAFGHNPGRARACAQNFQRIAHGVRHLNGLHQLHTIRTRDLVEVGREVLVVDAVD